MAQLYNISELDYTVKTNPEWFTRALFGGRLVQGGYLRILTGVKGDTRLGDIMLTGASVLQPDARNCAWTPQQLLKLSDKIAHVKPYKINAEYCLDDLENSRLAFELSPGAKNESLPDDLEAATLHMLAIKLSNEIEELAIKGDEAKNLDEFDGLYTTLYKSSEAIHLPGQVLYKGNILMSIENVYNAIPEEVLQAEDRGTLYILCSYNTRRALRAALGELGNQVLSTPWTVDNADPANPRIYYVGVEIVPAKGLDNTTLIAYEANNALLLTDLVSDFDSVRLGNFPAPQDSMIFVDGRLRMGFTCPFEDECVIMSDGLTDNTGMADKRSVAVSPDSVVFGATSPLTRDVTVSVPTGADAPTAAEAYDWLTVTIPDDKTATVNGRDTYTVAVTVTARSANEDYPRTGQVAFVGADGAKAYLMINQRGIDYPTVVN
jgi:hypothetical protein